MDAPLSLSFLLQGERERHYTEGENEAVRRHTVTSMNVRACICLSDTCVCTPAYRKKDRGGYAKRDKLAIHEKTAPHVCLAEVDEEERPNISPIHVCTDRCTDRAG